jgi:tetratricopeptide (TPR) repeat protein
LDETIRWYYRAESLGPGSLQSSVVLGNVYVDLGAENRAKEQLDAVREQGRESSYFNVSMAKLLLFSGEKTRAIEFARKALVIEPGYPRALTLVANMALESGHVAEARAQYEEHYPELLNESEPQVNTSNYAMAVNLAYVLSKSGEFDRADILLDRSFDLIPNFPRLSLQGYGVVDVQIYAQRGQKEQALAALRQAVDEGWRYNWWYYRDHDPSLESIRNEPEFQAVLAEVKADMAEQLAHVRAMEASGEISPP